MLCPHENIRLVSITLVMDLLSQSARRVRKYRLTTWSGVLLLISASQVLLAAEYIDVETPAPESATDISGPLDYAFRSPPISERLLMHRLKRKLDGLPAFWRDTQLDYQLRAYDFQRRNSASDKREARVIGGSLDYE